MDALSAEILSSYEAKLTASYSETYTQGTNAGVTVAVTDGEHGTVTSGESTHSHPGHVVAEILSDYSAQLTIGFSETYGSSSNAAVTVAVTEGEHATVTRGKSCQPACCPYLAIFSSCMCIPSHSFIPPVITSPSCCLLSNGSVPFSTHFDCHHGFHALLQTPATITR